MKKKDFLKCDAVYVYVIYVFVSITVSLYIKLLYIIEWLIVMDVERNCRGLFKVLSRHFHGATKQTTQNFNQDSRCPVWESKLELH
jgi:hypothetical protein